nr:hypothetical protein [uncultured Marinifilum sp.]
MKNPFKWTKGILLCLILLSVLTTRSQTITTNRNPVGLEHNLLFNATERYQVTQTGSATVSLPALFNGAFGPSYSGTAPTEQNPTVILIEGIPACHTQAGAWVGWSTRYWPANKFKIEAYNVHSGANTWVTVADFSHTIFSGNDYKIQMPSGTYSKLRFTFLSATGNNGRLGVSELFYLHPEATTPYYGLKNGWESSGDNAFRRSGNVGIGISAPSAKLEVTGTIKATEIKVEAQTADFVFEEDYQLKSLEEVEQFVQENKHLPDIPSARQMEEDGVGLAEMNKLLLQKVEELTLHVIELNKRVQELESDKNEK